MTETIKEEPVTSSHSLTIPSSSTIYFFCCQKACFSLFLSRDICTIDTSGLFWSPVSAFILCSFSFPYYYPLFSVGKGLFLPAHNQSFHSQDPTHKNHKHRVTDDIIHMKSFTGLWFSTQMQAHWWYIISGRRSSFRLLI